MSCIFLAKAVHAEPAAPFTTGSIGVPTNVAAECRADVGRLCGAVQPGNGRIILCLAENRARLSRTCSAFLSRAEQSLRR